MASVVLSVVFSSAPAAALVDAFCGVAEELIVATVVVLSL